MVIPGGTRENHDIWCKSRLLRHRFGVFGLLCCHEQVHEAVHVSQLPGQWLLHNRTCVLVEHGELTN
jgi:hypothetical protein